MTDCTKLSSGSCAIHRALSNLIAEPLFGRNAAYIYYLHSISVGYFHARQELDRRYLAREGRLSYYHRDLFWIADCSMSSMYKHSCIPRIDDMVLQSSNIRNMHIYLSL